MTAKIRRNYFYLCLLLSATLFTSCNHYFYTPPEGNLLMLSEQNDLKVSAGAGFSILDEGSYNVQAGYSPIKHLGVALNYFQVGQRNIPSVDSDDRVSSLAYEGAIGGYLTKSITGVMDQGTEEESVKNNKLVFDLYAGYGRTNLEKVFFDGGNIALNSQQYFLQGGIHFQSKLLGLSYTLRGVSLDYLDATVYGKVSENNLQDIEDLKNDPFAFLESSIRLRAGGPKLKCFVSRNWMTHPFNDKQLEYSSSSWHMGVIVGIQEFFKKKEKD